jgi:hypothetical protein
LEGLRRALSDAESQNASSVKALRVEYEALRRSFEARKSSSVSGTLPGPASADRSMLGLLQADKNQMAVLRGELELVRNELVSTQTVLAKDGLRRLGLRLSRLVRRARLGRIESVLGKKRALEVEVEAIAGGFLPKDAVDSLNPVRYLKDNEEYWPFEGDDWPDEFVGKER